MDDLPELPFEKVLSYLSLEDRLKARAVSRRWYHMINSFKVKSLCYSSRSSDFILGKSRWISGAFAKNFISSSQFALFFDTYGQTTLSSLKRLRLCDLDLTEQDPTALTRTLNSFGQLEQLDIIRAECSQAMQFNLNLPMLTSLQLEEVQRIENLTLEAPRLREVKILNSSYLSNLRVEIVHGESVERLLVNRLECTDVKKLKNLQYLYVDYVPRADPTFLSSLQLLKEFHTNEPDDVSELFEQKQRSGRADLKIYLCGLLLDGPDDPTWNALHDYYDNLNGEWLVCLAENPSRLADQIPFYRYLDYSEIEGVTPGLEVDLLKRFTHLNEVKVDRLVRDIPRFLDLLKNIVCLTFYGGLGYDHPQELFDRLPEHCAVQKLTLLCRPSDLTFLFRLKHLIDLHLNWPIDTETIRRAFEELPVLSSFRFWFSELEITIQVDHPKQFRAWVGNDKATSSDLNAAIQFITGTKRLKQRKANYLE